MQKKKSVKIVFFIGLGIVLISLSLFLIKRLLANKDNENITYTVNQESYENVIEISGTVSAAQEQTLQALSDGTVVGLYVQEGDYVKKGEVILQLDDTSEQYNLAKHDYDMATTRISGSERELKLMETQRLSLVQKIADRQVIATFDGVIAQLDVSVGDSLEAKDTVGTLVNLDYLTADVEIAETDVSKLEVGQKVTFSFAALQNENVVGYVVGWPAIGQVTSRGATIVEAKVRIDDYPEEILPYFSFTGKIELSPTQEYLVVSRYAIAYDEKGQAYVELARSGKNVNVSVERYGSEYVKVLDGLNGGEVLKQLTKPKSSSWNKNNMGNRGGPGNGGPGMGAGGPPPRM